MRMDFQYRCVVVIVVGGTHGRETGIHISFQRRMEIKIFLLLLLVSFFLFVFECVISILGSDAHPFIDVY